MDKKSLTEADIRSKYIDPAIINRGWTEDMIRREHYFTDGRVIFLGQNHDRQKGKNGGKPSKTYRRGNRHAVEKKPFERRAADDGGRQTQNERGNHRRRVFCDGGVGK